MNSHSVFGHARSNARLVAGTSARRALVLLLASFTVVGCSARRDWSVPPADKALLEVRLRQSACGGELLGDLKVCRIDGRERPESVRLESKGRAAERRTSVEGYVLDPGEHTIVVAKGTPCPKAGESWLDDLTIANLVAFLGGPEPIQPITVEFDVEAGQRYRFECVEGDPWGRIVPASAGGPTSDEETKPPMDADDRG